MSILKVDQIRTRSGSGSVNISSEVAGVTVSNGNDIKLQGSSSTEGQVKIDSTNLLVQSSGNKSGVRFDTNGLTPFKNGAAADDAVDLGFASGRFKDIYLSGGVNFSANAGSTTTGATTTHEVLDHYEEGTWTPTITGYSGGSTQTYQFASGFYTRIGRIIHATYYVRLTAKGNISGNYTFIAGWPYPHTGSNSGTGVFHYIWNLGTARDNLALEMGSTSTVGWVTYLDSTSTAYLNTSDLNNNTGFTGYATYVTNA